MAWRRWSPAARIAIAIGSFAAVTFATYLIAHPRMFTGFAVYDDEGYMLVALQSFLDRGSLYDDVFTQYGPFYYQAWAAIFSILGIPVTHDGGRAVTLVVWVASALAIGLATARITGSVLLGLATQVLVFASIGTLTNEPMHPGGIIVLLLAGVVAVSCWVRARASVGAMALLGGAIAALILVKVNVGVFALLALALACAVSYAPLATRRWVRLLVELGFVTVPLVLMGSKLGESWAREYALHVSAAALAVVLVLRARELPRRPVEELWWLVGGMVAVAVVSCVAIVAAGTSPGGLVDGLIAQPLRQSEAFSIPLALSSRVFLLDAVAVGGAIAYLYVARGRVGDAGPAWSSVVPLLSILVGVEMALSPIGRTFPFEAAGLLGYQLSLLAFAWVALIPPPGKARPAIAFPLLLLPPLAVLQALHAFPVAGSQLLWSAFLLVPVGAICVGNGVRGLAHNLSDDRERKAFSAIGAVAGVLLIGFIANTALREPLRDSRAAYDASVPLDLPGARDVRLSPEEAELYAEVTAAVRANCVSFVMLPGMNSFYVWTGQRPPTGHNATAWPTLFSDERQRQVIGEIASIDGLCLLENESQAAAWGAGSVPDGPLTRYMEQEFQPLAQFGNYSLLTRSRNAGGAS